MTGGTTLPIRLRQVEVCRRRKWGRKRNRRQLMPRRRDCNNEKQVELYKSTAENLPIHSWIVQGLDITYTRLDRYLNATRGILLES